MISIASNSLNILQKKFNATHGIFEQREKVVVYEEFDSRVIVLLKLIQNECVN